MKKVSTTTAKQGRNIAQQKLTLGLDLGDRNSWYCVLDEAGQKAFSLKFRLLSIRFTLEAFVSNRKMSEMRCYVKSEPATRNSHVRRKERP